MAAKNSIGWFEIYVSDIEKAKDFYGDLFEWQFKLLEGFEPEYTTIFTGEDSVGGGFMKSSSKQEGQSVVIYIDVEDVAKSLKKVEEKGGKIEKPKTLISATSGYYGLFRDLDNNLIGLWSEG
ncbi:MAG: VOC family protein [Ignavibacteria bacterium]|nr:VOC family protein [Ignavibacteria bacterium]